MLKELKMVLENMLRRQGMWRQYRQNLIMVNWAEAVGDSIAAVTRARQLTKGRLWVTVKDSTWAYHLTLLKPQLLEKINQYAGTNPVQDIYFIIGEVIRQEEQDGLSNNTGKQSVNGGASPDRSFIRGIGRLKKQAMEHQGPAQIPKEE